MDRRTQTVGFGGAVMFYAVQGPLSAGVFLIAWSVTGAVIDASEGQR